MPVTYPFKKVEGDPWRNVWIDASNLGAGPFQWETTAADGTVKSLYAGNIARFSFTSNGVKEITCVVGTTRHTIQTYVAIVEMAGKYVRSSQRGNQAVPFSFKWKPGDTNNYRIDWTQVAGPTLTGTASTTTPTLDAQGYLSGTFTVTPPVTTGKVREVYAFVPTVTELASGAELILEDHIILVPSATVPLDKSTIKAPMPGWATADVRNATLASETDYAGAPSQSAIAAKVTANIAQWGHIEMNMWSFTASCFVVDSNTPKYTIDYWDLYAQGFIPGDMYSGTKHFVDVPIPDGAVSAPDTDGHVMFYNPTTDTMWEFWLFHFDRYGKPKAGWGGRIDNYSRSDARFTKPWGVTASGLSWAPIMVTIDEAQKAVAKIKAGGSPANTIPHMLYTALIWTKAGSYCWPANRTDGNGKTTAEIMEGQVIRLDPSIDITTLGLSPIGLALADAAQRYGMMVADKAGAMNVGFQAGLSEEIRTGVNPWVAVLDGQNTWDVWKGKIPTNAWQVVKGGWHQQFAGMSTPVEPTTPPVTPPVTPPTSEVKTMGTQYSGTLSSGDGSIRINRLRTGVFESEQFYATVKVSSSGAYQVKLPAGTYRVRADTLSEAFPALDVVSPGSGTSTFTFGTPIRRGAPTPASSTSGTGSSSSTPAKSPAEVRADSLTTTFSTNTRVGQPDVSGLGNTPTFVDGVYTYGTSGTGNGAYRSEHIWGYGPNTTDQLRMTAGDYIAWEYDLKLGTGFASQDSSSWNVLSQIHGPSANGTWNPPPVELNYQNTTFRVSNSSNVPLFDGTTISQFDEWRPRIVVSDPIDRWLHWKFGVYLSGPGMGTVDAWLDGKQVVFGWQPLAGTIYMHPNVTGTSQGAHNYVVFKTGLYGGQTSGTAKDVSFRNLRITAHRLTSAHTLRPPV